jgi:hypothetical protein
MAGEGGLVQAAMMAADMAAVVALVEPRVVLAGAPLTRPAGCVRALLVLKELQACCSSSSCCRGSGFQTRAARRPCCDGSGRPAS